MSDIVERMREDAIDHFEDAKQWDQAPEQTCNWQRGLNANEASYTIETLRTALQTHAEEAAKLIRQRDELLAVVKAARDWLEGWASAEPYLSALNAVIEKHTPTTTTKGCN